MSIFLTNHVAVIYMGRFLGGMGQGFELSVATVYIVEIASTDMRGTLGCFVHLMGSIGVLSTFALGSGLDWKNLALESIL
jgi:MFS family permease